MWMLALSLLCVGAGALQLAEEPQDRLVTAGERLDLQCRVRGQAGPCTWQRDGRALQVGDMARAQLVHGCSLTLHPVLPRDQGQYSCSSGDLTSREAQVTVVAEPGVPHIRQGREGEHLEVTQGSQVHLQCESQGGVPPAELEWRVGGSPVTDLQRISEQVTRLGDTGTWKTVSTFTFLATEDSTVTCQAASQQFPAAKLTLPLQVKVRFRPNVEILVNQEVVREGDSFEVLCKSLAYPEEVGYRWFFKGLELEGLVNNSILIEEISRMYDQADISCLVDNEEGRGSASTSLDILYSPTILLHPRSQIAKRKDNVTFHCVAEGNPTPAYLWTRGRTDSLVQAGRQNLSLVATERTEAVYKCQVFSEGHELVSSLPASLTLIRKPVIDAESRKFGSLGQDAILQCRTRSVSNRTRIVWLRDLEPLDLSLARYSVVPTYLYREQRSDLLIRNLRPEDFGQYGCFAENEVGTAMQEVRLVEDSTDILTLVVGLTCVLGLLLLLAIFLYYRARRICGGSDPEKD